MPGFEWFGDEEKKHVNDVLETGVLFRFGFDAARKGVWKAREFEAALTRRLDVSHGLLCANGTAALSIALAACGVGAGDEVILPPFTFVATVEAVLAAGAIPVFADIDRTLCLDPAAVAAAATPKTRAVILVHMCGSMGRVDKIAELCRQRGWVFIEDTAQSFGGSFQGKALGSFGTMGSFSFDPVKTITCGEGGAVVTDDKELYLRADAFADHGHDHVGNDRGLEDHLMLGYNYRISELNAAVGLAQLGKIDLMLERQRAAKAVLAKALAGISGVEFREIPDESGDTATFFTFFLPDEDLARKATAALAEKGVDGCFYWYGNKWHYIKRWGHITSLRAAARLPQQLYPNAPDYSALDLGASDAIMKQTVSMQIKLSWTPEQIRQRAQTMADVLKSL